jgi:DNA-directed RNA polymerase specialized sigma24 family protein
MNYPRNAAVEFFDTHGDRLFRYCWSMLRSREMAQIALRDTLLAAQAHMARRTGPQDPGSLDPWLYSLARAECRQHVAVPAADEAPGISGRNDADSRLIAWHAAMSLEAGEFEVLELASRHDVDPGLVLGRPAEEVLALLARARQSLERALGAEILLRRGPACPDLAGVLAGWEGPMTARIRNRVLEHAARCQVCTDKRPRNVSAARVFALLPAPALSPLARAEVLGSCAAHQQAAAPVRPWPALPPPVQVSPPPVQVPRPAGRRPRRVPRAALLIAGAGAIASAVVIALALAGLAGKPAAVGGSGPATAAGAPTGPARPASGLGAAGPVSSSVPSYAPAGHRSARSRLATPPPLIGTAGGRGQVLITAATQPLLPGQVPAAPNGTPAFSGTLQLSTASVNVGTGSAGQITLTAVGGAVSWSASSSAPNQVSLSSYAGTLQAGQNVTLTVAVTRGAGQGSALLSFEPPASAPQLVQVSWAAPPESSGHPRRPRHPRPSPSAPAPSPTSPSPSDTASASPSSSWRP